MGSVGSRKGSQGIYEVRLNSGSLVSLYNVPYRNWLVYMLGANLKRPWRNTMGYIGSGVIQGCLTLNPKP